VGGVGCRSYRNLDRQASQRAIGGEGIAECRDARIVAPTIIWSELSESSIVMRAWPLQSILSRTSPGTSPEPAGGTQSRKGVAWYTDRLAGSDSPAGSERDYQETHCSA
jgi:hypothetical protein